MQLIPPSAAKAATKYSRLMAAARFQPSAFSGQLPNNTASMPLSFAVS
jgi:hypothetical protein